MKYRKLRITWSVLCGILCLLLIALGVRNHSQWDDVVGSFDNNWLMIDSLRGQLAIGVGYQASPKIPAFTWDSASNIQISDSIIFAISVKCVAGT